jgi:DNA-binding protein H-NS
MAQTYAQMQAHIAKLQAEAEAFRRNELAGLIARIKEDIRANGLTPQDLFGKAVAKSAKGKGKARAPAVVKYADGAGNFWVGRGKRPKWLSDALNAGKKLEDYLFGAPDATPAPATKKTVNKAMAKKAPAKKAAARKKAA